MLARVANNNTKVTHRIESVAIPNGVVQWPQHQAFIKSTVEKDLNLWRNVERETKVANLLRQEPCIWKQIKMSLKTNWIVSEIDLTACETFACSMSIAHRAFNQTSFTFREVQCCLSVCTLHTFDSELLSLYKQPFFGQRPGPNLMLARRVLGSSSLVGHIDPSEFFVEFQPVWVVKHGMGQNIVVPKNKPLETPWNRFRESWEKKWVSNLMLILKNALV